MNSNLLSDRQVIIHRIGFLEGAIEGIRLYAIWSNGKQLVGCMKKPLEVVLEPLQEELDRLSTMMIEADARSTDPTALVLEDGHIKDPSVVPNAE